MKMDIFYQALEGISRPRLWGADRLPSIAFAYFMGKAIATV
jgi:hypothetical protein